jgi:Gram-negative bacterial tonB protein.
VIRTKSLVIATLSLLVAACASSISQSTGTGSPEPRFDMSTDIVLADTSEAKPASGRLPRYPADAKAAGMEAGFATVFVEDTTGRVEYGTVSFTTNVAPPFRNAVCSYLRTVRLAPVVRDGRPRRALVIAPWAFGLEGGQWQRQRYDAEPLRRSVGAEGIRATVARLESQPHC